MNIAQSKLLRGAIKSAVSSATGVIIGLNIVDPTQFSVATFGGWKHLAQVIFIVVIIAEARFFKQWADSGDSV